jgi:hypothetical protein
MSYDIFLACIRGDDTVRFKREVFEEVFLAHCPRLSSYREDPWFMQVEYPDGGRADIYIRNSSDEEDQARRQARNAEERLALPEFLPGDPARIENLGFDHFGGTAFFRDLYTLADRTGATIFAGAMRPILIVTKESVLTEMPPAYRAKKACVVRNPAELEDAVFAD